MFPTPGYCDEEMFYFRVSGLTQPDHQAEVDEDEDIEVRVFTLREAREMIRRGEIIDMKTVIGLTVLTR
jgi:ADP-ribose pyrophosphatase